MRCGEQCNVQYFSTCFGRWGVALTGSYDSDCVALAVTVGCWLSVVLPRVIYNSPSSPLMLMAARDQRTQLQQQGERQAG